MENTKRRLINSKRMLKIPLDKNCLIQSFKKRISDGKTSINIWMSTDLDLT